MALTTAKWTIEDYHRIIAAGILVGRQVELLNGEIVEMVPERESHAYSSDEAGEYLTYLLGDRAKVRQGKPITLLQSQSKPEPDIARIFRVSNGCAQDLDLVIIICLPTSQLSGRRN